MKTGVPAGADMVPATTDLMTEKLRLFVAELWFASPDCVASMVQVPVASNVISVPAVRQTEAVVVDVTVTGRWESASAATTNGALPRIFVGIALNVMVCGAAVILKDCVLLAAAV